ncbi:uncharacterized protein LOC112564898 [Pomacea canaliculata]|uniref:uncharacterized protein LOC112564898 n=1 Tax=Pomacea canaliculata TaxID=400727 RepID=UPI000D73D9DB|nr:uncharacterized protein LOC112564898 [Pomacea canaliculata]
MFRRERFLKRLLTGWEIKLIIFLVFFQDLYNIPITSNKRIQLCNKELFQEPSCTPGLGCLKDLGGRVTNYRFYLLRLRTSGKGSKLSKSLLTTSINALQDVLVYLQRDCKARSAGSPCVWPDPAPSCLPSGQNLAFDNGDVADETAVTLARGLLEVVGQTKYA